MIKKLTDKEFNRRDRNYGMMFGLGSIAFVLALSNILGFISFTGSEILLLGVYGLPIAIWGIIMGYELEEQIKHPEKYNYCNKCKRIIRKKHKFCSSCRCSIKRSLNEIENKKHFKDYKKFYKEKKK